MASDEVWILGATGRSGRAVAARLAGGGGAPVLVGRGAERLEKVAADVGAGARTVVAGSVEAMADAVRRAQARVVVNTVGPFTGTAVALAEAGLPGSHYLDLANDVVAASGLLGLHDRA